ncbi:MAG: sulfatase [Fimbriimonas sp.]|nr:sulfatase [Fimbriimonas sp.]
MRILYIDIDSLRPDHLGCYGYHRNTSPNIDVLAAQGARMQSLYASDTPCLPSRTGFFGGRFGTRTGVVNHGGVCADLQPQGRDRDFRSRAADNSLASLLTRCGYWTASVSPFPRRHSAYQMTYGFNETIDTGRGGMENADEIYREAERWLKGRGKEDNWFLHVNMWDPHTPYDTPVEFGNPFAEEPIDPWITEEVIARQRASYGPHSAHEVPHYDNKIDPKRWTIGRGEIQSLEDAKVHLDGYDCGVRYADMYVGKIIALLDELGVLEETAIVVAADHGENLGELNIWGDHQTADEFTNHIPGVIRWPGVTQPGSALSGFRYHLDLAATIVDLCSPKGRDVLAQAGWDGSSFAPGLQCGDDTGRGRLFLSQGAWSCQRTARWNKWILIHTIDTGTKDFSEWMLFDLEADPHQTRNLVSEYPEVVETVGKEITEAFAEMSVDCPVGDPFEVVISEGGPLHARVGGYDWEPYLKRLTETGRGHHADWLREHGNAPRPSELAAY